MGTLTSQPTRECLLAYLADNGTATVPELSKKLHLTRPDIQYHIKKLLEDGLILLASDSCAKKNRGRPSHRYRLNPGPKDGPGIETAKLLLAIIKRYLSSVESSQWAIDSIVEELYEAFDLRHSGLLKIQHGVSILEQHHYRPKWEIHQGGPRIILTQCPFASLAERNDFFCDLDKRIISYLFDMPIAFAKTKTALTGGCIFQLGDHN